MIPKKAAGALVPKPKGKLKAPGQPGKPAATGPAPGNATGTGTGSQKPPFLGAGASKKLKGMS